jgi:glycosyltransferase involved in cell wall biosynthesis
MKILILMRSSVLSSTGGAETQVEFIRRSLVKAGHEVHIAFESQKSVSVNQKLTVYHLLPERGRLLSFLNAFHIGALIKKIRPDVIYQRVRFSYTGIAAFWAQKYKIVFVHGISADYACKKNKTSFSRSVVFSQINERLGRYGLKEADQVIAQTFNQQELLRRHFLIKSVVIPNGHPVPHKLPSKSEKTIIIWVANIKPWKQPELFLKLAKEFSGSKAEFIMVGKPHGGSYQRTLEDEIGRLPNVRYLGQLSLEEVNDLLAQATIFVNTSQPREGFPNTFIQAWLRKTPVVTLDFDPDDLIKKRNIGFHSQTFQQMVMDVSSLLMDRELLESMGERARELAEKNFDSGETGARHLDVFEKAIQNFDKLGR